MKWLSAVFVLFAVGSAADAATSGATAPQPPLTLATLRQICGDTTSPKIVFRDQAGKVIDENTFMAGMHRGLASSCKPANGSGVAVMTLAQATPPPKVEVSNLVIGEALPAFSLTSSRGRTVTSRAFDHDLTVIDFFYDCTGCIADIPALNAFHAAHPETGALSITYDSVAQMPAYQKQFGLTWEIVPDAVTFYEKANIQRFPTVGIVDRHGRLLALKEAWTLHPPGRKLTGEDIARWVADVRKGA
ncbi:TlpA family protein disulfide reductase [Luteibacter aegosomatissinici]|uniref:TlpA family protein disulfide reductase n=1 Tax=Luteibacter aegosomatissinici TaxID=2911539 RepID=UPI001FF75D56|nr:TlpA disulfide reductase family protein [Luteibacter aegosomatissinici]UPG93850.1 TlpA family protein disulfide reductase [Luteibacter aegosomatissinici]